jgi:hypothetical protein
MSRKRNVDPIANHKAIRFDEGQEMITLRPGLSRFLFSLAPSDRRRNRLLAIGRSGGKYDTVRGSSVTEVSAAGQAILLTPRIPSCFPPGRLDEQQGPRRSRRGVSEARRSECRKGACGALRNGWGSAAGGVPESRGRRVRVAQEWSVCPSTAGSDLLLAAGGRADGATAVSEWRAGLDSSFQVS